MLKKAVTQGCSDPSQTCAGMEMHSLPLLLALFPLQVTDPSSLPETAPAPARRCAELSTSDSLFSALCLDKLPADRRGEAGAPRANGIAALPPEVRYAIPAATALLLMPAAYVIGIGAGLVAAGFVLNSGLPSGYALLTPCLVTPTIAFFLSTGASVIARAIRGDGMASFWNGLLLGSCSVVLPAAGALVLAAGGIAVVCGPSLMVGRIADITSAILAAAQLAVLGGGIGILASGPVAAVASVALDLLWPGDLEVDEQ